MNSDYLFSIRQAMGAIYLADETTLVQDLLLKLPDYPASDIVVQARHLLAQLRSDMASESQRHVKQSIVQAFLQEYQLDSEEGLVLMGIAEALLRIPDRATQDRFLADRLSAADWHQHAQHSDSSLVNLATDALAISKLLERQQLPTQPDHQSHIQTIFKALHERLGRPVIRTALERAMHVLAEQFVMAETIEQAIAKSANAVDDQAGLADRYSFDMLGEAAITAADAERFFKAYSRAITQLGRNLQAEDCSNIDLFYARPSISIKLSALYPRYEPFQHRYAVPALTARLFDLALQARSAGIALTIDAEESERLDLSMDIFAAVFNRAELDGWSGLGIVVQAYQKRATHVIRWLAALAQGKQRKIPVRLVKGAYWDSEIKRAQENGLDSYPVFTRKSATDISYLVCARLLIDHPDCFYPQFATHNVHTIAAIIQIARQHPCYEFQRLHGMGTMLYQLIQAHHPQIVCRVYAPVGEYRDLLPYLVRRLLENGANTSFVHHMENPDVAIEEIVNDPVHVWQNETHSELVLPAALYGGQRRNSHGLNLADPLVQTQVKQNLDKLADTRYQAFPLINGKAYTGHIHTVSAPYNSNHVVGVVNFADKSAVAEALDAAESAFNDWRLCSVKKRAGYLLKAADQMEQQRMELVSLCMREGGRTIKDALAEVREAVDFCRYYAARALELFERPTALPGPTGEDNVLRYYGRGVFVCISPWNFPIAIFAGQVAAALAAGNTVVAKPAERTALTAMVCVRILHQAGIPESVLHFLPGKSSEIGRQLLDDYRLAGVAFTGSIETARYINRQLANHPAIVPLIAETGGQNVLIADTSAHKEQLVQDAVLSAFNSAGQRCSALRVLFVPQETADTVIEMLVGAMQELRIGKPDDITTDVAAVIAQHAAQQLGLHVEQMRKSNRVIYQLPLPSGTASFQSGNYFPPTLIEINEMRQLHSEVFGPILHIVRYQSGDLNAVINSVNAAGYGLTFGIHSRIRGTIKKIQQQVRVGNIYVNRNMIGAVVGVQPFGGMGLSGTGPKAGGPDYLRRFAVEQAVADNAAAMGGNPSLLAQNLL
ncbi:RHH-type transcriptional regulator, proline utilization regulon repressor / proline dehydrogenase / delta 1-pyrroline-5-carboxylate dehydrogenase [Nitrosomonas sp. Nm51]|uniref:bifunctional proline dehydrogenase/L-glutamate gamma-semialdehyde dehydrogenase PutA n=1 Tax=Nitrosomonas sp. Nm51 TaxID=133720 RepID=UPI0008D07F99|nr:bifunctional proline dehydrogenase/L-glutamate gamma-semialdehyde dehydrogenase PutA [Nitrosomonas sp. Nm51]SEQ75128.1 RHH-type transcriptional regulator, proline utilization regulon repressor / proline dehydrogenase / delta 1-pyrroline-5-carboxylate dehydrogenase [Nitrosomonas sp. Nm51]